jgi:predicted RNA-binding Zn-ribbon protein involved in translation (DUF1610 family)
MVSKAGAYLARATRLLCPVCGKTPIFPRALSVRRLWDWFNPLDGCPRCGYAFEREPGYFLMAVWAVNCGLGSLLGLIIYFVLDLNFQLPLATLLAGVIGPVILFHVLFARHSKAYFIALDHLLDPHERGGGDDRGNQPLDPDPEPTQPCETITPVR